MRERLQRLAGFHWMRCRDCGTRFRDSIWRDGLFLFYAKCPKCTNLVLKDWEEKYYLPPRYKRLLLKLGAREQRCEPCRYNFVSFRPRWKGPAKENGSK